MDKTLPSWKTCSLDEKGPKHKTKGDDFLTPVDEQKDTCLENFNFQIHLQPLWLFCSGFDWLCWASLTQCSEAQEAEMFITRTKPEPELREGWRVLIWVLLYKSSHFSLQLHETGAWRFSFHRRRNWPRESKAKASGSRVWPEPSMCDPKSFLLNCKLYSRANMWVNSGSRFCWMNGLILKAQFMLVRWINEWGHSPFGPSRCLSWQPRTSVHFRLGQLWGIPMNSIHSTWNESSMESCLKQFNSKVTSWKIRDSSKKKKALRQCQ